MPIKRQLKRWVEAGLLLPAQAERIALFETSRSRPSALYAAVSLAALAIAVGVVSMVAANWDAIPGRLKLGVDLLLLAALGQAVARRGGRAPGWFREAATLVLYGLVLASIALVGQVYQLGGKAALALALWSGLTFLLMAQARSAQLGLLWLLGLQATYAAGLLELGDLRGHWDGLLLASAYWLPLACLALARSARVERWRPQLSRVLQAVGWIEIVLAASLGTLAFYEHPELERPGFWLGASISAAVTTWLCLTTPRSERVFCGLLVAAFAAAHLPLLVSHASWPLAAASSFMGLWAVVALAAHRSGVRVAFHLATAALGLRLLIVYFEVFGSLLGTGLGLVGGGLLLMLLTWLWARRVKRAALPAAGAEPRAPVSLDPRAPAPSPSPSERWLQVAVLLPLFGLGLLMLRAELRFGQSESFRLNIVGYDPRDLLRGHYLQYSYALDWQADNTCGSLSAERPIALAAGCCVCLTRGNEAQTPRARQLSCGEVRACDGWLRSESLMPPLRYFVPEARAVDLQNALGGQQASLDVRCGPDGTPQVGELYLNGRPWREAIE
jgi:uncharacterized membrane protein